MLIGTYLNAPNKELIKNNNRLSKANYSSRKNFLIEIALLEKQSVFDNMIIAYCPWRKQSTT